MNATLAEPAVRERPIIFSAEMVRAILDGQKTQTRRVMKPQPVSSVCLGQVMWGHRTLAGDFAEHVFGPCAADLLPCPYGQPGDRLWVRETFATLVFERDWESGHIDGWHPAPNHQSGTRVYDADPHGFDDCGHTAEERGFAWTPPIFMPRWASRIDLEITGIRVQRLCAISAADAWQEGIRPDDVPEYAGDGTLDKGDSEGATLAAFADRWNEIHWKSGYSWGTNPWVWVIEFAYRKPEPLPPFEGVLLGAK